MRAVNLIPEELRPRIPGDGDPRIAYGVLGGLAVVLVMVLLAISYSNKLKTIEDQTAAIQAETLTHRSSVASVATTPDELQSEVKTRTLLVGGLAKTRFPWGDALYDLSRAIPSDTTLTTISVQSAGGGGAAATGDSATSGGASMTLNGCTSSWVGYSRFMTWLKTMPGVAKVKSSSSAVSTASSGGGSTGVDRTKNCGPAPLNFALDVTYMPRTIDLLGLPKPDSSGATGATGAASAGVPAASTTPAPAPAAGGE
jgi:Tfp pilus assembly protein PilN